MKARILAMVLAVVPSLSWAAAATWTLTGARSAKAVCASGTCDAPTLATEGANLDAVSAVSVLVCADSGQTITGGSGVSLYFYDATPALWGKKGTALTVPTGSRCAFAEGDSPGLGIPVIAPRGRLAAIPIGITVSSGGVTVFVLATGVKGEAL
jgi:hypothetical protein